METTRLYHQDDHLTSFEATVVSVDPVERSLVLDATAFYPTGGHQHCDQGQIARDRRNFVVVTDVKSDPSGIVLHRWTGGEGRLRVGDRVRGAVHAARRLHHMQLHTAQHALSCFAADRFGSRTGRADFAPGGGLVVIEPELDWKQALLLEDDVNRLIRAGRPVSRRVDEEGGTRIAIDGLEETRCAGTHVTSTSEIGLFKLLSLEGKVLRYEVGTAAMRHAVRSAGHAQEASRRLGLERTRELATAVDELIAERDRAEKRFEQWRGEATARNATSARRTASLRADGVAVLRVDLTHLGARESRELLEKGLTAPGEVWVGLAERGSLMVSSGSERVDARAVVSELTDRWGVRGGGGLRFAQCGPVPDDVGSPLKKAVEHIMTAAERVLP